VQVLLEATQSVLIEHGVHALTPTAIAQQAGVPVPSIYRYFDDVDSILLALLDDFETNFFVQPAAPVAPMALHNLIADAFAMSLDLYAQRPAMIEVVWRYPRVRPAVHERILAWEALSTDGFLAAVQGTGLVCAEFGRPQALFGVQMMSRMFQIAYANSDTADPHVVAEGTRMLVAYLENFALGPA
jgi:AcrR family transcriptional regulator